MFLASMLLSVASASPPLVLDEQGNHHLDMETLEWIADLGIRNDGGELLADGIVNGSVENGYPNTVALAGLSNWGGYVFCSGTLISKRWILTAAHCVVEIPGIEQQGMNATVLWGTDLYAGADDSIRVANWYPHPDYNAQQLVNDIGLIELEEDKNGVDFAVLNDEAPDNSWLGEDMAFVGFGITSDNANDSGIKRSTDIAVQGWDNHFIQSYTDGTNLCSGDSGGSAFENNNDGSQDLAGVNSWVSPGCVGGSNGVTRVDVHIDWILGYVPDALTAGDGSGSGGNGGGGNGGGGGGLTKGDSSTYDRDLGTALRPGKGDYPTGVACSTGAGTPIGGLAGVTGFGLFLTMIRRRRA